MEFLEIIQKVMDQHKVFVNQFEAVSTVMSDKDALLVMEKAQTDLGVDFRHKLEEKRSSLLTMLKVVESGLKNHYAFEEQMLPPLLGPLLTEGLILEHKKLTSEMSDLIATVGRSDTSPPSYIEEIGQEAILSGILNKFHGAKLDHLKREEALLVTLQIICAEKAKVAK
jgi:hypothetical protein